MPKKFDVMDLTQPMDGPPLKIFIRDSGGIVREPCVLVGHIVIEEERREYLDELGINTTWAYYHREAGRWEQCLLSEAVADMLVELHAEGSFPHAFEVGPSRAEVAWIKAQANGETHRPEVPLHHYILPAEVEALDEVATLVTQNVLPLKRRLPRIEE